MTKRTVFFMLAMIWLLPALISFAPIFLGWYTTSDHLMWLKVSQTFPYYVEFPTTPHTYKMCFTLLCYIISYIGTP